MNHAKRTLTSLFGLLAMAGVVTFFAGNAWAQQKTVEHREAGPEEVKVELTHSTVVYVEGNHLVTRQEDGSLEALLIPESFRFHIDDRQISVHELKPGMIISEEITSRTKPMTVRTVEIHDGTLWQRVGNRVFIRGTDGKSTDYTIPEWAMVSVEGREETVHELRLGMKINATIITEEPHREIMQETKTYARHPSQSPAATVTQEQQTQLRNGTENREMAEANPSPAGPARGYAAAQELPRTASPLPLIGLLGLLFFATAVGLRVLRSRI